LLVFAIHLAEIFARDEIITDSLKFTPRLWVAVVGKKEVARVHLGGTSKRALPTAG
jgi:hypothetical protein